MRLGQVDFINCLPVNLPVESGEVKINAEIIKGVPSELNQKILTNEIDIAPVSSLTYIENKDKLIPIANMCIASDGSSDSVLLFSSFPIEELDGAKIATTYASATSNKLLEVLLKEFLKVNVIFKIEKEPLNELSKEYPACLFIGDHALLEYSKMPRNIFIYDLGSLWKKYTGLPMVFGVWVARKEVVVGAGHDLPLIVDKLQQAKNIGLGIMFDLVIKKAQEKVLISKDFYNSYFQHLSYELTDECKKGLEVFEGYCLPTMTPAAT
ncbi:MAG: menaquinone biosynthesis protein [Candidatus Melainabacteria bacterium]|nr:menaquinone biosynthesis protein [Candidatus Melainabacteria bacterium]